MHNVQGWLPLTATDFSDFRLPGSRVSIDDLAPLYRYPLPAHIILYSSFLPQEGMPMLLARLTAVSPPGLRHLPPPPYVLLSPVAPGRRQRPQLPPPLASPRQPFRRRRCRPRRAFLGRSLSALPRRAILLQPPGLRRVQPPPCRTRPCLCHPPQRLRHHLRLCSQR